MEENASAFPWVPEYEDGLHRWGAASGSDGDLGLIGRGCVAVSELIVASVELYLLFFVTCVVTALLNAQ